MWGRFELVKGRTPFSLIILIIVTDFSVLNEQRHMFRLGKCIINNIYKALLI